MCILKRFFSYNGHGTRVHTIKLLITNSVVPLAQYSKKWTWHMCTYTPVYNISDLRHYSTVASDESTTAPTAGLRCRHLVYIKLISIMVCKTQFNNESIFIFSHFNCFLPLFYIPNSDCCFQLLLYWLAEWFSKTIVKPYEILG